MTPLSENIGSIGEFGLIEMIGRKSENRAGVVTGIGDDSAVTEITPGMQLLSSTDMLIENIHFRLAWHDPYLLGRKSLAASISDIAAMGGIPRWALLSMALPAEVDLDFFEAFIGGFLDMASEHGVSLTGGDTSASPDGVAVSVTMMGEQFPERIIRRSGARVGDEIWVTGTPGDAAMGLRILESRIPGGNDSSTGMMPDSGERENSAGYLVSRLLNPVPRVAAALSLADARIASAMTDISDGLIADFGHIAEMSAIGGEICIDSLPVSDSFLLFAGERNNNGDDLRLSGGEDYELCFTASPDDHERVVACMENCGVKASAVGLVTGSRSVKIVKRDGSEFVPDFAGFNHFIKLERNS